MAVLTLQGRPILIAHFSRAVRVRGGQFRRKLTLHNSATDFPEIFLVSGCVSTGPTDCRTAPSR